MLTIQSSQGTYDVVFVPQFAELIERLSIIDNAMIVMDQKVSQLYPEIKLALELKKPVKLVDATEENKILAGTEEILLFLQQNKANKNTAVIAIGGGITQNIVSSSHAAWYCRGQRNRFSKFYNV